MAALVRVAAEECVVSVASVWEVAIKHRIGKLPVAPDIFANEMRDGGAVILSVTDAHATAYVRLPAGHTDPFDRLLVAVAQTEKLKLITADSHLLEYAEAVGGIAIEAP